MKLMAQCFNHHHSKLANALYLVAQQINSCSLEISHFLSHNLINAVKNFVHKKRSNLGLP